MSSNVPISPTGISAPTPQNTPFTIAPISSQLSRPNVPDIAENDEDDQVVTALKSNAAQHALMDMMQKRLYSLIGKSSGYIESLPVPVKRTLAALHSVQFKQTELQKDFKREMWELEKKYSGLATPLLERRNDIITGAAVATEEEIAAGEEQAAKDNEDYSPLPKDDNETAPIDNFWLTALRNHIGISDLITDRDAEALKHLKDIHISYDLPEDKLGFKLVFYFSPNDYFDNEVLDKTYIYRSEIDWSGDFVYECSIGSTIDWKQDKDLTKEVELKKQRNKNTNHTRVVRKTRDVDSFFNFFNPPQPPSEEELEHDESSEIEGRLALDYQIGEDLKERIIPHAVDYFTGKALEYDAADPSDEGSTEDDENNEDDDGENDEDDDEDEDEDEDADIATNYSKTQTGESGVCNQQ